MDYLVIDLGNFNIKTNKGVCFKSCFRKVEKFDFSKNLLELDGNCYEMGIGSFDNEYNKTKKDYLPNLLHAIHQSIEKNKIEINVVLGVPSINMSLGNVYKEQLENKTFKFIYNDVSKTIKIGKVAIIGEGFGAFYALSSSDREKDSLILDIGGRTINFCTFVNGTCRIMSTHTKGMIDLYNDYRKAYNSEHGCGVDIEEINRLIKNNVVDYPRLRKAWLMEQLNKIKLDIPNFENYNVHCCGGGSLELNKELSELLPNGFKLISDGINANVIGNSVIARLQWGDK